MRAISTFATIVFLAISIILLGFSKNKLNENQMLKKQIAETQEYYKSIASTERVKNILHDNVEINNDIIFYDLNQTVKVEKVEEVKSREEITDISSFSIPNGSSLIIKVIVDQSSSEEPFYSFSLINDKGDILFNNTGRDEGEFEINNLSDIDNLKIEKVLSSNVSLNVYYETTKNKYKLTIIGQNGYKRIVYIIV